MKTYMELLEEAEIEREVEERRAKKIEEYFLSEPVM